MSFTADEIAHAADLEESRLSALVDQAAERISELAHRSPRSADERHDLRTDRENAVAEYEAAQDALSAFWAIGSDEAMADYLAQPVGVRASWLAKQEAAK